MQLHFFIGASRGYFFQRKSRESNALAGGWAGDLLGAER
jgi:hypothetical protein